MSIWTSWRRGVLTTEAPSPSDPGAIVDDWSGGVPADSLMPGDDPLEVGVIVTPTGGILWGQRDSSDVEQDLYLPDVAAGDLVSVAPDTGLLVGAGLLIVGVLCVALLFR